MKKNYNQKKERVIGLNNPCFIIAEVGSVHDGNINLAKALIKTVAETRADAVKFQTHIAEAETLKDAPPHPLFKNEPRYEYFIRTGFTIDEWQELKNYAEEKGLVFISSSFSIEATELLEKLGVQFHKVPSGEVINIPYLKHMAKTGKTILLSSGMGNWEELNLAVETIKKINKNLVVFQCTTEFPVKPENVGINVMLEMKERYNIPVGLSDHSANNYAAFLAVSLGAKVIEKHITLSRKMYGSDASHSLEPNEFRELVQGIRVIEKIINAKINKDDIEKFKEMRRVFQKSVVTNQKIKKGKVIKSEMLVVKKPGTGITPKDLGKIVGKKVKRDLNKDYLIKWSDLI